MVDGLGDVQFADQLHVSREEESLSCITDKPRTTVVDNNKTDLLERKAHLLQLLFVITVVAIWAFALFFFLFLSTWLVSLHRPLFVVFCKLALIINALFTIGS